MNKKTTSLILLITFLASVVFAGSMWVGIEGTVEEAGVTSFMYGTHILVDAEGKILYALRSTVVNLDDFIYQRVAVEGILLEGYPIDGGPDYIDVSGALVLE